MDEDTSDDFLRGKKSVTGRVWRQKPCDERIAAAISQQLDLPEIVGRLLAARGQTVESAAGFLNPSLRADLPDPSALVDMDRAVERLLLAIQRGEGIAVFGDYDVDGATSAAVLQRYFKAIGISLVLYIPDRIREGYGPNAAALQKLKEGGAALVITVDCGTMAYGPLEAAADMGLDVIVVDHHKAEPRLPEASAVINPNRLDDESGLGQLAAVGVAFMLVVALNRALREKGWFEKGRAEPRITDLLDLVALGTVCDMVPLTGLNRAFVTQGLKVMSKRRNIGLRALADASGMDSAPGTYHAGFLMGPRVNAGGRVGEAGLGARLLTTSDETEAAEIAGHLSDLNKERQAIEAGVQEMALAQIEEKLGPEGTPGPVLVAAAEGWHPGVIGIVASRLKERYGRPSVVLAVDGGEAKGSARSISGVDIGAAVLEAMRRRLLLAGGGHAMAAGMTIEAARIDEFTAFLEEWLGPRVEEAAKSHGFTHEGALSISGATPELVEIIETVGPFGSGNPGPRFVIPGVSIFKADVVGSDHVRVIFGRADGRRMKGIAFRAARQPLGEALLRGQGSAWHLAGRIKRDDWYSEPRVELILEDAARAGP